MTEIVKALPTVRSSEEWIAYFEKNANELRPIPWELGVGTTGPELAIVTQSLRSWQLGESSDGLQLQAIAERYAKKIGDPHIVEMIALFTAEEQRHGATLGRFLDLAGVRRAGWDWGDAFFRVIRHALPRMEVWVTPVIMAEIHAMVYYNAIRKATPSPVLRAICEQLLADEVPHIRFQCERLATLHRHRSRFLRKLTMGFHRFLFAGITLAVWVGHRKAIRAGGYGFKKYWRAVWGKMQAAWRTMSPDGYSWTEQETPEPSVVAKV